MLKLKLQYLTVKDPVARKEWRKEKGPTKDKMAEWHHQLNRYEFEQIPGDSEGQRSLVCCHSWGCKKSDTTEQLNNTADCKSINVLHNITRLKNKILWSSSIDSEKSFAKIHHLFIIKTQDEYGSNMPQHNKDYDKCTTNIMFNGKKLKSFPWKSGMKQGYSLSPCLFNIVVGILAITIRQGKEIERTQTGKEQ